MISIRETLVRRLANYRADLQDSWAARAKRPPVEARDIAVALASLESQSREILRLETLIEGLDLVTQ